MKKNLKKKSISINLLEQSVSCNFTTLCKMISTYTYFTTKTKDFARISCKWWVKSSKSWPTCALHPAGTRTHCLPQTVKWALRSLVLKSKTLWAPFRGTNSRPFSACVRCKRASSQGARGGEHTRGLIRFVYVLISSALDAEGAPWKGRDHLLSVSVIYMLGVSYFSD